MRAGRIFLGLGANLGDREENLCRALVELQQRGLTVVRRSSIYETEPLGVTDQPLFLNAVCEVATTRSPERLLRVCLEVEKQLGRVRRHRWGPRSIDLDILLFGGLRISRRALRVPHPELRQRRFVLVPLAEIAGRTIDPESGRPVAELLASCPDLTAVVKRLDGEQWSHFVLPGHFKPGSSCWYD